MYERKALGLEEARGAVDAMIQEVKNGDYYQYGSFAVVDYNGLLIYFARMDRGGKQGADMAIRKAYTAALWGRHVSQFLELIREREWSESSYGSDYTVVPGGVAIIEPGHEGFPIPFCLGAIGVANAGPWAKDEAVAMVGLEYIQSILWPSK